MAKRIIVFSGKQYSGKDTVAKILLDEFKSFKRIGLGDAIKIEYGEQKGLTFEEIEANKAAYRAGLIALGNQRRSEDKDYWIKKVIAMPGDIIVPDVRVEREYEFFKAAGAFRVRVNATRETRQSRGTLIGENDVTEVGLDNITDWDFVIDNDQTYDDLLKNSAKLITAVKEYFFD